MGQKRATLYEWPFLSNTYWVDVRGTKPGDD